MKSVFIAACLMAGLIGAAPGTATAQDSSGAYAGMDTASSGAAAAPAAEQADRAPARFAPFEWLVGEWRGYGEFSNRTTWIHKRFGYDVGGVYFYERTVDMFPPAELSTDFELHQDVSYFYRVGPSGEYRAKSFYMEGFVTSASVAVNDGGREIVIEATSVENGPPGMRSRITYTREGPDRFRGLFELAMPGKEFGKVEELTMTRVR